MGVAITPCRIDLYYISTCATHKYISPEKMGSKNGTWPKSLVGEIIYPSHLFPHEMFINSRRADSVCACVCVWKLHKSYDVAVSRCIHQPERAIAPPPTKQTTEPIARLASALQGEKGVGSQLRGNVIVIDPESALSCGVVVERGIHFARTTFPNEKV